MVAGGAAIPQDTDKSYDFERLERAVHGLVERYRSVQLENGKLRRELEERDRRIGALDEQILDLNQRRQDVGKRIDELISQIDQLDADLGVAGE